MELEEMKNFIFASIISADNDEFTEDTKQEVMYRYELEKTGDKIDWEFVLEPLGTDNRLLELFI